MKNNLILEYPNTLYPRTLWVVSSDCLGCIDDNFQFRRSSDRQKIDRLAMRVVEDTTFEGSSIAGCWPVVNRMTGDIGVICVIFLPDQMEPETMAHESVHIADYFYEEVGLNVETFTQGNEGYAYLVGWSTGCIDLALKEIRKTRP